MQADEVWDAQIGVLAAPAGDRQAGAGGTEELMRYALERLQTGIEGIPRLGRRPTSV
jgi:hypothetical protein